jgi:hypothetical protein
MSPITIPPTRGGRAARVNLERAVVTMIARYPHLVRESDGDRISFAAHAWSALRILRIVGMESENDEEIFAAAEESERIVAIISESLRAVDSSLSGAEVHNHRLCPCHRSVELGRIAPKLGRKIGCLYQRAVLWHQVVRIRSSPDILSVTREAVCGVSRTRSLVKESRTEQARRASS